MREHTEIEVNWNAYPAMLEAAKALLKHAEHAECEWKKAATFEEQRALGQKSTRGETCPPGYTRESAALFCAFAFEAYLNHLGAAEIPCWDDLDRLSWDAKLRVVAERLGLSPDMSRRPFQTLVTLFQTRNARAHGRDIRLKKTMSGPAPYDFAQREVSWANISQREAERNLEDVTKAIMMLNGARSTPSELLFFQPISMASSTLLPDGAPEEKKGRKTDSPKRPNKKN